MFGINGDNLENGVIDGQKVVAVVRYGKVFKAVVGSRASVRNLYAISEEEAEILAKRGF